ncbi:class I SAM-dependent methyltransferase [Mucilaginibacter glaciei]|uniref:Class I SAM-dependent methyltransferase n=1 Tax=Mucilaginibacter glaciei TaxID=2772109 RepID=A0A926S2K5_9SPHI|nr:class I SAM-dependent methyltransferase [Mucilaginibacter glaciei]MBD1393294.1 class I SAM-dependent methyltransferase [Mucilaginibacter glaciei]
MGSVSNPEEEIFCLKYELDTLANVLLRSESERWVPGYLQEKTEHSHIGRYNLACNYTNNKQVIDIACGVGKGSFTMGTKGKATSVKGFDIQPEAIRYAKWRYSAPNVQFDINNAEELCITNEFDLAVSFETVEHLPNYRDFFASIANCLKPDGRFLLSTPISPLSLDASPANPYHEQEWGFEKFQQVLSEYFEIEEVFVQLYPKLPDVLPAPSRSILARIGTKIKNTFFPGPGPVVIPVNPGNGFSTIEKYTGQYPLSELGTTRQGYQIVLVKKKAA